MKVFVVLAAFVLFANAADEYCYRDAARACNPSTTKTQKNLLPNCNAKYGAIDHALVNLQKYVTTHITRSFEYLMMSTHFANYEKNRLGFEQLFRKMSDSTWEDSIDLIKYISKRGGIMDFNQVSLDKVNAGDEPKYEMNELESLAKAVDMQKQLATDAFVIHEEVSRRHNNNHHDPEISSFIEERFAHKHADTIRSLSGHVADLSKLLSDKDSSLSLFLFDEYLQKL